MPYKPTGKPSERPKAPTPIVPATPAVMPEQGTLQETIMLGDAASITANPATKLRWFATRAEIQIRIQNDEIGRAKAEASAAVAALSDAQAQLKTAAEEITHLTAELLDIESTHNSQLESERRKTEEAVERANVSYGKVKEFEPLAARWTALQSPDASSLGELSKQDIHAREVRQIEQELKHYDLDRELRPSGLWRQSILSPVESKQYLEHERELRRKLVLLTETETEREERLKTEAAEKEAERKRLNAELFHERERKLDRDDPALRPIQYTRDQVYEPVPVRKPKGLLNGHWPY